MTTKPGEPLNYDRFKNVDGWILPDFDSPEFAHSPLDGWDRVKRFTGTFT
jgi:hypothetical protein